MLFPCIPNIVNQGNIPQFSKLDNIGTPLQLLESFFDDSLVDMIFDYTKLYSNTEKAHTCFEISNGTFPLF